jgi:alkylation response protein AidB-like acyl-CoA dehydrogenase
MLSTHWHDAATASSTHVSLKAGYPNEVKHRCVDRSTIARSALAAEHGDVCLESEELIRRAQALVPPLRDRAELTKRHRRVPAETIDDFHTAGLLNVLKPVRLGGYGGDFPLFVRIASTLAHGCGSSAWVYAVLAEHNWAIAMFPEETQAEFWSDPRALASSSLAPAGKCERISGGFRLSGDWPFSSGCDHAGWALLGSLVADDSGGRELRDFLVPMNDIEIIDDWYVLGMAGTGSKTLRLRGAVVPEHRSVAHEDLREARAPGRRVNLDDPLYRAQRSLFASFTLVAVLVGLAQRAVDLFVERTAGRVSRGIRLAELDSTQLNVAEAAADADAATLFVEATCGNNLRLVAAGESITVEHLTLARRNAVYAAKLASRAVDRVFKASGAHALFDGDPLQVVFCDANAAAAHLFLNWELGARPYGQYRLGLPIDTAVI